jgi:hypothetical protein
MVRRLNLFGFEPQLFSYRLAVKVYVLRADLISGAVGAPLANVF